MITKKDFNKVLFNALKEEVADDDRWLEDRWYDSLEDCVHIKNQPIMVGVYELKEVIMATLKDKVEVTKA